MIRPHWKNERNVSDITDNEIERNLKKFGFQSIRIIRRKEYKSLAGRNAQDGEEC